MIDELDRQIIVELQKNGRETYKNLAKKAAVVEGTVRKRVKNLMKRDIVRTAAVPNVRKLGYSFVSIIGLQIRIDNLTTVAENLAQNYHVCYLAAVTGRYDFMAVVVARSPEEHSQFVKEDLSTIPGILRAETFVNLNIIKGEVGLLDTAQLLENLDVSSLKKTYK